jgi:hypothetical protein
MTDEELANYLVENGASDDEVIEAIRTRRTDPRQTARGMRPETRDDDPITLEKGRGEFRSISPSKEREVQDVVRQIRTGKPGSPIDEAGAKQFVRDTSDSLGGGPIDPIAMAALSGPFGFVAGNAVRGIPAIARGLASTKALPNLGAGLAVGGTEGAVSNVVAGGSPTDPLPVVMGGLGRGPRGRGPLKDGTRLARVEKNLAAVGGEPAFLRPAKGGMFDEPGYRKLPEGPAGTEQLARDAYGKVKAGMQEARGLSKTKLDASEAAMVDRLGDEPLATHGERADIAAMRSQRQGGAGSTEPRVDDFLADVDEQLAGASSKASLPLSARLAGTSANTAGELRNLQKALNQRAKDAKVTGDPAGAAAKQAAGSVRKRMREADPEFATALDEYGAEQRRLGSVNQKLHSTEGPVAPELDTKAKVGTNKIKQAGQETESAASAETDLRAVEALDPIAASQIPRVRAHNAAKQIEFSIPGGTNPMNWTANLLRQNLGAFDLRALDPMTAMAVKAIRGLAPGAVRGLEDMTDEELAAELAKLEPKGREMSKERASR